ncbi:uncharacterized protein KRP23_13181 [Phytophthora ramorum]|uniref:uncharacterized protein n=1 Tax=Phytophthora ramorum TaxID=164328 RepID=UPI0030B27B74|nr:hypothetical protein KRP23_13181 [Phytophthora ramorum]
MLRLVAARSRLMRVEAIRVVGVLAPRSPSLAVAIPCSQYHLQTLRFSSSSQAQDDGSWTTLAVYNPVAWQQAVKPAFLKFLQLQKHLLVPIAFRVPYGDEMWPKAAWGYPLGKHARWLRKQWRKGKINKTTQKELDEMPFAWDRSEYKWAHFVLPAFRRFYEFHGHTKVPHDFIIPEADPEWPEHLWGQRLGYKVISMRSQGDFAKQATRDERELEELGFVWDLHEAEWSERIFPALEVFYRENGHCRVPQSFVVPSNARWRKQSWGLKLGAVVNNIRVTFAYATQTSRDRAQLEAIGFVWDFFEEEWSGHILPALETFYRLSSHCRVPRNFVVPAEENWPEQSWGLKLGSNVYNIRNRGAYSVQVSRDRPRLEAIGFVWDFLKAMWSERILPALKMFYRVYGHSRVPHAFVIPADAAWPEEMHGFKLGYAVTNIRHRGSYFDQAVRSIDELKAIEFDLQIPAAKWELHVEPLLATFEQLHGHRNVPLDFVIPSSTTWGEKDWGIPLGKLRRKEPSQND